MRKKTDTTKKTSAPAKRLAKPVAVQPATTRPAGTAKPKPKNAGTPRAPKAPVINAEEVALRAYFISEKRLQQGVPGDEHQDWLEAERQIRAEASPKKSPAKKRPSAS